jgi:hypothetical protein
MAMRSEQRTDDNSEIRENGTIPDDIPTLA